MDVVQADVPAVEDSDSEEEDEWEVVEVLTMTQEEE